MKGLVEQFKAWRRGDRRISPPGTRGRVYERSRPEPGFVVTTEARGVATIRPTRIYRAATDTWEEVK